MLIDAAKGLEPQTRKLFEVCKMRELPIFTFVNKLDRPGREPRIIRWNRAGIRLINLCSKLADRYWRSVKGVYDRIANKFTSLSARRTVVGKPPIRYRYWRSAHWRVIRSRAIPSTQRRFRTVRWGRFRFRLEAIHAGQMTPFSLVVPWPIWGSSYFYTIF